MKKALRFLILSSAIACSTANGALVAHYTFDELEGSTALDSSGNNHHGTTNAGVTFVADGGVNGLGDGAFAFNGTTGFVTAGKSGSNPDFFPSIVASNQLTLSAWIKTEVAADNRNVVVYAGSGTASQTYVDLGYTGTGTGAGNGGGAGSAYTRTRPNNVTTGTGVTGAWSPGAVNNNEWNHLVMTLDASGTNSLLSLYVNGVLQQTLTLTDATNGFPTLDTFSIGRLDRGSPTDYYEGLIDDVQVYSTALTATDVQFLYNNPGQAIPEPSLSVLFGIGVMGLVSRRRK